MRVCVMALEKLLPTLLAMLLLHGAQARLTLFNGLSGGRPMPSGDLTSSTTTERPKVPATYYVTFPTKLYPGAYLPVRVHLMQKGMTASVSVSLRNIANHSQLFAQAPSQSVTGGGQSTTIELPVPRDLKSPTWRNDYAVCVIAQGGVNFNQSKTVTLSNKVFSVFVQTDKAIYKPGQTVKLRALLMNPNLTIRTDPMDIVILDPLGNRIKLWKNATGFENTGVVEKSMCTSFDPPLERWYKPCRHTTPCRRSDKEIQREAEEKLKGKKQEKTFSVAEYVLPKFETILEVPKYAVSRAPALRGKVKGKYTHGKPLTGGKVTVTVKYPHFRWNDKVQPQLTTSGVLDENGEYEFGFYKKELMMLTWRNYRQHQNKRYSSDSVQLDYRQVLVIANVTDSDTGKQMGKVAKVWFKKYAAKVEFLPINSKSFKPGLKHTAYVSVVQNDDKPFPNYRHINVSFEVQAEFKLPTTTTTTTTTTTESLKLKEDEGEMINDKLPERGIFLPPYPGSNFRAKTKTLRQMNMTLTPSGLLALQLDVPPDAERLVLRATALDYTQVYSADKALSASGNFLQIQTQPESPQTGKIYSVTVRSTEPVQNLVYQLYGKGIMLNESEAHAIDDRRQNFTISFRVTNKMAPNVRLLVFYFRHDGEVVVDSMSYKVEMTSSGLNVSYNKHTVKPGEAVQLNVTAPPSSTVFLLAIDKSVQLLKSGNDITQEMVDNELVQYDFGRDNGFWRSMISCGWPFPGRGTDADSIFQDANVGILTDGFVYKSHRYPYGGPRLMRMRVSSASDYGRSMALSVAVGDGRVNLHRSPLPKRLRTLFPETWLWDIVLLGKRIRRSRWRVCVATSPRPGSLTSSSLDTRAVLYMARFGGAESSLTGKSKAGRANSAVERVRNFFPETWLFSVFVIGSKGEKLVSETAPDTITTWLTSAFAIHPQHGLSVLQKPAELVTFRSMFVSLDMPYSMVRGEDLCMNAIAHNYHTRPLYMRLTLARNANMSNIRLIRTSRVNKKRVELRLPMRISQRLGKVKPNNTASALFCFTPNTLGEVTMRVNLTSTTIAGDGVERQLLVKAEGVPRVQTTQVILDMKDGNEFQRVVPISFPNKTVHGSQKITITIASDLLGQVMDNLDDLLRMPYGCGEQNMLYFAPNVFLIDYLKQTNTYTPETAKKAEEYMLMGYQKELKYKHKDGSYSAFGEKDTGESGSMWLTAFVTKCFVQSMALGEDVISVEPKIVHESLMWMVSKQHADGSFPEPGKVFNKNMQGGSAKGEALTAYVLIALVEANKTLHNAPQKKKQSLSNAISMGRFYLEQRLAFLNDSYDLCIVSYVLHLVKSTTMEQAFVMMRDKAIFESMTMHWQRSKAKSQQSTHYSWQPQTDALSIEMTSYALMTFLLRKDLEGSMSIVRWLTNQRGPQGGFISTQDTVMGLQALTQIAAEIYQPTFSPITVSVDWSANGKRYNASVTLDDHSKMLLHKIPVPFGAGVHPKDVRITAKSATSANFGGLAVAAVVLDYNMLEPTNFTTYSVLTNIYMLDGENFVLEIKAARVDDKIGSMTVLEVGIPTGYSVVTNSALMYVEGSKMTEASERKFVLYYDELGRIPVVINLHVTVAYGLLMNSQPVPIQIYDYYEAGSDQQMTLSYLPPTSKELCAVTSVEGCCSADFTLSSLYVTGKALRKHVIKNGEESEDI